MGLRGAGSGAGAAFRAGTRARLPAASVPLRFAGVRFFVGLALLFLWALKETSGFI
jgi:hypothetical protein